MNERTMSGHVYVYATGDREDGMKYAVGHAPESGPANGSLALFQEREDALVFAEGLWLRFGVEMLVLPSVEKGE